MHDIEGVNIHLDTPMEVLHTFLLGVVKYWWGQTVHIIAGSKHMNLLQTRLASLDMHGLNAPSFDLAYVCHYKGGLIGKHFKSLAQLMAFTVGAHMLICIYAQSQSKYISVFSSILFLYYFHFTVRTPFQFFPNFSLFFLPFYSLQKPVILTRHC